MGEHDTLTGTTLFIYGQINGRSCQTLLFDIGGINGGGRHLLSG